jgi:hypothetical protein
LLHVICDDVNENDFEFEGAEGRLSRDSYSNRNKRYKEGSKYNTHLRTSADRVGKQ